MCKYMTRDQSPHQRKHRHTLMGTARIDHVGGRRHTRAVAQTGTNGPVSPGDNAEHTARVVAEPGTGADSASPPRHPAEIQTKRDFTAGGGGLRRRYRPRPRLGELAQRLVERETRIAARWPARLVVDDPTRYVERAELVLATVRRADPASRARHARAVERGAPARPADAAAPHRYQLRRRSPGGRRPPRVGRRQEEVAAAGRGRAAACVMLIATSPHAYGLTKRTCSPAPNGSATGVSDHARIGISHH